MIALKFDPSGITLLDGDNDTRAVKAPKWVYFLCLLVGAHAKTNTGQVEFKAVARLPLFAQGRRGHKSERTINVEIDNFRRQMRDAGLHIHKSNTAGTLTYALDPSHDAVNPAEFATYLRKNSEHSLNNLKCEPLPIHLAWLMDAMKAKVAFANGEVMVALNHYVSALERSENPILRAASYAEIARATYRADRDRANDLRDAAIEFSQSDALQGFMRQIYLPRIQTAYAFQDIVDNISVADQLSGIIDAYVTDGIDVAGLSRTLNTRGVMTRRHKSDADATHDFQLACVLSISLNDPDLIQASLFNLLASLEFDNTVSPKIKIEAAEVNYWFCEHFNVGKDSAQCSLLLSQFYLKANDLAQCEISLRRAAMLMRYERNATDIAYFFYCRAHFEWLKDPTAAAKQRPRIMRAERVYKKLGNRIGLRKVDWLKKAMQQGG